jgi:aquaporin Z
MHSALSRHWPEYAMEALCLGAFMFSACLVATLLEHPSSPIAQRLESAAFRRFVAGLSMAVTALCIFLSPYGRRSGAHINPAVTLTYLTLGRVRPWDAFFYIVFQFLGGAAGVGVASLLIGPALAHSAVDFAATLPGPRGAWSAFFAELLISALMMSTVLVVSNRKKTARFTPFFAATLIALFITFESPVSGMSMNPARTTASAIHSGEWTSLWVYYAGPLLGMLLASAGYRFFHGGRVYCAKLHHENHYRCIFRCGYGDIK